MMRVFVTGATGALGRYLVPGLVAAVGRGAVVAQMTTARGSSNQKARRELGWVPQYPSWREGFRAWVSG